MFSKSASNDDEIDDLEDLNQFDAYDNMEDLFEDDDDLRALEEQFLKDANAGLNIMASTNPELKKSSKGKNEMIFDNDDENAGQDDDSVMKSYFMNMLKSADRDLIDYKVLSLVFLKKFQALVVRKDSQYLTESQTLLQYDPTVYV